MSYTRVDHYRWKNCAALQPITNKTQFWQIPGFGDNFNRLIIPMQAALCMHGYFLAKQLTSDLTGLEEFYMKKKSEIEFNFS